MWPSNPFRISRAMVPFFALFQVAVFFFVTPLELIPGGNWNLEKEIAKLTLPTLQNRNPPAEVPSEVEAEAEPALTVRIGPASSDPPVDVEGGGCQRHVYHKSDLNPNTTFPETRIFHPPPIPSPAFNSTLQGIELGIRPRYGRPHCQHNAILSFVYGYQLPKIIHFVNTLLHSGFDGDLVLGVTPDLTDDTREFLQQLSESRETKVNLVVYEISLTCSKLRNQFLCQNDHMFRDASSKDWIADLRPMRRVATLRFEYYWAWSSLYSPESKLFVTDARDVYFQGNPIPRDNNYGNTTLILFEEAATIEQSRANSNWLRRSYSNQVLQQVKSRRVICSGTTLGGQPAMEAYARAMVHEFDRTNCRSCGHLHDQCFHNYLVHFDRLLGTNGGRISAVDIHEQGKGGIVNTVGLVSKRNNGASLKELGLVQNGSMLILDNDNTTVSAVIHMFDRDPEMNAWVQGAMDKEMLLWNTTRSLSQLM